MDIAKKLRLPSLDDPKANVVAAVADYLTEEDIGPWLMVLDNADDLEMFTAPVSVGQTRPLADFIPRSANGQVVITTREYVF